MVIGIFGKGKKVFRGRIATPSAGLLDSIKGKLDDKGGSGAKQWRRSDHGVHQRSERQAFLLWYSSGRMLWAYALPPDYHGEVPAQMLMIDVPEADYIVFEHGPFGL